MFYTVVVTPSAAGMPKDRDRVRLFKLYFAGLNRSKAYISMLETLGKLSLSVSAMKHGYGGNHGATGPALHLAVPKVSLGGDARMLKMIDREARYVTWPLLSELPAFGSVSRTCTFKQSLEMIAPGTGGGGRECSGNRSIDQRKCFMISHQRGDLTGV